MGPGDLLVGAATIVGCLLFVVAFQAGFERLRRWRRNRGYGRWFG